MPKYLYTYNYDRNSYGFTLNAENKQEADRIIEAVSRSHYDGELKFSLWLPKGNWFKSIADTLIQWLSRLKDTK
jgi:uncharacterized protein YgfB (UPF0149 family)